MENTKMDMNKMVMKLSDRANVLTETRSNKYYELRSSLKRAIDSEDTEGYLAFGNADAGRDPYIPEDHIRQAAKYAIDHAGTDLVYTPAPGLLEVREAIASKCERENGYEVNPKTEIHITVGTQMGIFCTLQSLINPGDKVLIPDPDYSGYNRLIRFAGGVPVHFPFKEDDDGQTRFNFEAMEKVASTDIKLMMFTNPNNPGGYLMTRDDLEGIAEIAKKEDFIVFADDLYEKLVYDDYEHISFASLPDVKDRTVTIMGVSKTESMQMFRIGFIIAPEWIMKAVSRLASSILIRSSYISQKALLAFLKEEEKHRSKRVNLHTKGRDYVYNELNKIDGIICNKPMGTSYVFPNHRELNPSSADFAFELLSKGNVSLNPGHMYGPVTAEGHQRMCIASPIKRLEEGIRRIKLACEQMLQNYL